MKTIVAVASILLVVQLVTSRPQEIESSTGSATVDSSLSSCCPDGNRPCSPCDKKTVAKIFKLLPATLWGKPFAFFYKTQDGTVHQQTGIVGPDGVKMRGKFSYIDKCTGKKFQEEYVADKYGFRLVKLDVGDQEATEPDQELTVIQNELSAADLEGTTTLGPAIN